MKLHWGIYQTAAPQATSSEGFEGVRLGWIGGSNLVAGLNLLSCTVVKVLKSLLGLGKMAREEGSQGRLQHSIS